MNQSPRIINIQQNVAVQAPPKKTGGGGRRPRSPPKPRRPRSPPTIRTDLTEWEKFVRKVVLAAIAFIFLLILVGIITSRYKERKICNTEGTFTLNEGQTLILSAPVHSTCEVPNGSKTEPGCFIYDDNKNCSLKIKPQYPKYNQITYQLHLLDVQNYSYCGDYLSIQGHDEQMCSQISTAQNEVKTMQNEIEIFWFTDSINNTDCEGFTLWIWEETANE